MGTGRRLRRWLRILFLAMPHSHVRRLDCHRKPGRAVMARTHVSCATSWASSARCTPCGDAGAVMEHAEQLFSKILEQDGARLPSDRRFAARVRTPRDGIHIPRSLHESITEMAAA